MKERSIEPWNAYTWTTAASNSGEGQEKKEQLLPRAAHHPADIFAFWPCSRRAFTVIVLPERRFHVPVIIVLTFVWLFPSCRDPACTLRILQAACLVLKSVFQSFNYLRWQLIVDHNE